MWCDGCRAVGMIHCAHPDECGNMLPTPAAPDYRLAPHLQRIVDVAKTAPQWDTANDRLAQVNETPKSEHDMEMEYDHRAGDDHE